MSDSPIDALPRAMPNVVLQPSGWPRPKGYANGIKARGDLLFIGGMVGADERGRFAPDFLGQTRQLLANILTVLAEGGASARHIVRMTWYVRDMDEYLQARSALGEVYRRSDGRSLSGHGAGGRHSPGRARGAPRDRGDRGGAGELTLTPANTAAARSDR